jgi:uncharacterized protein YggE
MRKILMAAILATTPFIAAGEAMASEVHVTSAGPVIDLTITESVEVKPDIATFSTGVQTLAPTANDAIRQNNVQMAAVIAKLKKLGIAEKDIQTTQINLSQSFDYNEGRQKFNGYQAANMVNVKLRDLKKLGAFLDALASDGATNFNGPNFGIEDDKPLLAAARDKVWSTATERARLFAKKSGYSDVRVIRVEEGGGNSGIMYASAGNLRAMDVAEKSTPIAPGEISVSSSLSFTFEMVK